jgi:hypothetical protein
MFDFNSFINTLYKPLFIDNLNTLQISFIWVCILLFSNSLIFIIISFIRFLVEKYHYINLIKNNKKYKESISDASLNEEKQLKKKKIYKESGNIFLMLFGFSVILYLITSGFPLEIKSFIIKSIILMQIILSALICLALGTYNILKNK